MLIGYTKRKTNGKSKEDYLSVHYVQRSNWLRAAVLGANDGILSTASLAIGIAAASATREPVVLATLAGLVAGALSMAAGEYVSVSSQTDVETADIAREKEELEEMPEIELQRLADIYEKRGLKKETAMMVALEMTYTMRWQPICAMNWALMSSLKPTLFRLHLRLGLPLRWEDSSAYCDVFMPLKNMEYALYGFAILFLALLGARPQRQVVQAFL